MHISHESNTNYTKIAHQTVTLMCLIAMLSCTQTLSKRGASKTNQTYQSSQSNQAQKKSLIPSLKMPNMTEVSAFFGSYVYESPSPETEHPFPSPGMITINNIEGNITITGWQKDTVQLKTVKTSSDKRNLQSMFIQENSAHKDGQSHLSLTSTYQGKGTKGAIHYELQVPLQTSLKIRTGTGEVNIRNVQGKILGQTGKGPIIVQGTKGTLLLQTEKRGDITATNIVGEMKTITHRGSIIIRNASNSVIASADRGKIDVSFERLPETARVELHSAQGNVNIALPSTTNAHIYGHTKRGILTSNHYIALRPHTTQLNKAAWEHFKKEVEGTIGTGEADIKVTSTHGNINILDTTSA